VKKLIRSPYVEETYRELIFIKEGNTFTCINFSPSLFLTLSQFIIVFVVVAAAAVALKTIYFHASYLWQFILCCLVKGTELSTHRPPLDNPLPPVLFAPLFTLSGQTNLCGLCFICFFLHFIFFVVGFFLEVVECKCRDYFNWCRIRCQFSRYAKIQTK